MILNSFLLTGDGVYARCYRDANCSNDMNISSNYCCSKKKAGGYKRIIGGDETPCCYVW